MRMHYGRTRKRGCRPPGSRETRTARASGACASVSSRYKHRDRARSGTNETSTAGRANATWLRTRSHSQPPMRDVFAALGGKKVVPSLSKRTSVRAFRATNNRYVIAHRRRCPLSCMRRPQL
eukprot:scaffold4306_cov114-Isochrysis_galbana.AAC.2